MLNYTARIINLPKNQAFELFSTQLLRINTQIKNQSFINRAITSLQEYEIPIPIRAGLGHTVLSN